MTWRVGIDIGGTFTDFALAHTSGASCYLHKQLTTPDDPSRAVHSGLRALLRQAGLQPADIGTLIHGTTLVTNALIERRGARTAMLVTAGFGDVLDIARERRYDMYELGITYPAALIERALRIEVDERIDHQGQIVRDINLAPLHAQLAERVKDGLESIAICLLNSPLNARHEIALRDFVRQHFPNPFVTLSSEVFPFLREYERWNTACMNAYTGPLLDRYLARLQTVMNGDGFTCEFFIMTSSGGMVAPDLARRFPIRLLESGPAAGVLQSVWVSAQTGRDQLLAFDMGGTTAKGALIRSGQAMKRHEMEVARVHEFRAGSGLPVRIPVIDLIEIGAGGGSIARLDDRGMLAVGPRSAGAVPGPCCYGLGGIRPTLTDANLVLGYLDADFFLGGTMPLDLASARAALERELSDALGASVTRIAWGIHENCSEDVARAFRKHAAERGFDYRHCAMVAFGGSGPVHACAVARKLGVPHVIVAPGAGVMSAIGLLSAPLSFEVFKAERIRVDILTAEALANRYRQLLSMARNELGRGAAATLHEAVRWSVDMRYVGQGYDLEVALPQDVHPDQLPELFARQYAAIFGKSFPDQPAEITHWKLTLSVIHADTAPRPLVPKSAAGQALKGSRAAWDPVKQAMMPTPVYDRSWLAAGEPIQGPALIEDDASTCVMGPGDHARIDAYGNLVITVRPFGAPQ